MKTSDVDVTKLKELIADGNSPKEIGRIMGLNPHSVPYYIKKLGLKTKKTEYLHSRNLHVLMDDSLITFYWIGFLLADGYVTIGNGYPVMGIELSMKDSDHLNKLAQYINVKVSYRTKKAFSKEHSMCFLKLADIITIPKVMEKYQIQLNKSLNPPNPSNYTFNDDQKLAMLIGFIDGDGTIIRRKKPTGFQSMIGIQTRVEWKEWLEYMLAMVKDRFDSSMRVQVRVNVRNHAYLCLTKQTVLDNLRQFAVDNQLPILDRKWDNTKTLHPRWMER